LHAQAIKLASSGQVIFAVAAQNPAKDTQMRSDPLCQADISPGYEVESTAACSFLMKELQ
jgi:hypothetical protein